MIQNTFQILEKIGNLKEKSIWRQGVGNWDKFLGSVNIKGISRHKKSYFDRKILEAKKAIHLDDSSYFNNILASSEKWRLYDEWKTKAVFLDIETNGLDRYSDIMVIGLFDGIETKTMIKGINLRFDVLNHVLSGYKLILTFNGSSFDIPFIKKRWNIIPSVPHIDIKHCCAKLGLTGGLKQIEKEFQIRRSKIIEKMYGGDALRLWKIYRATGDRYYLDLLVEYNCEDVVNLKKIMDYCYEKLSEQLQKEVKNEIDSK